MPIICPSLGRLVTGIISSALGSLKMNQRHAQSLGMRNPLSEVRTPPHHNRGMVLRLVAIKTHTCTPGEFFMNAYAEEINESEQVRTSAKIFRVILYAKYQKEYLNIVMTNQCQH